MPTKNRMDSGLSGYFESSTVSMATDDVISGLARLRSLLERHVGASLMGDVCIHALDEVSGAMNDHVAEWDSLVEENAEYARKIEELEDEVEMPF